VTRAVPTEGAAPFLFARAPNIINTKETPVVLNLGMGVDSVTIAHRWLTDPATRDFGLARLVVTSAMTGDEFDDTKRAMETYLLPLFRHHGIRYVQLARNGHEARDGITVLSDTRQPDRLHAEGVYKLSDELAANGTVPQVGSRRCSIKYKGWVIDQWLAREFRGRPFRQVMGFNADEQGRVERDHCYGGDNRTAEYPLLAWGMGRAACEGYLLRAFGIAGQNPAASYARSPGARKGSSNATPDCRIKRPRPCTWNTYRSPSTAT
jgi:hypothetical protein